MCVCVSSFVVLLFSEGTEMKCDNVLVGPFSHEENCMEPYLSLLLAVRLNLKYKITFNFIIRSYFKTCKKYTWS